MRVGRGQRTLVVNVYQDPANPQGSTRDILAALERQGPALLA